MYIMVSFKIIASFPESDTDKLPFFNPTPNNVSFGSGETALLKCSVMNADSKYVVWRRTSEPNPISVGEYIYSPDNRYNISRIPRKYEWNLLINNVQERDAGVYECALASRTKLMRHVLLRVIKSYDKSESLYQAERPTTPEPTVTMSGTKFITKGETIQLQCNATGSYVVPSKIDWFRGGNKLILNKDKNVEIENFESIKDRTLISNMVIRRTKMSDAGVYVCRSTDLKIASFRVHVLDDRDSLREKVKRGTNGGKNHCCVIFSSNFVGLLILVLTLNYIYKRLSDV